MTHDEMLTEFTIQNLKKGDSVEIELNDGNIIHGRLSDNRVFAKVNEKGEKTESRIGLLPPTPAPGKISLTQPTPIYSETIVRITRI